LSYTIFLHPKVAKQLAKMNEVTRSRVRSALVELQHSPESKGERLHPSEFWKIRIGDYRAIYLIDRPNKSIVVIFVGHRSKVYDEFERML
jgi:mRNA interferase RelE/StbE